MKSDKRQTSIMIGISLIIIAGVIIAFALSQPKIYNAPSSVTAVIEPEETTSETENKIAAVKADAPDYPLNINTATLEELMTIDGLGEKKACAIIEYREHIGRYKSVEQITEIEGFGEETYKAVAGYLTV